MATINQVRLLEKLHKEAVAASAAGLPPEVHSRLAGLDHTQTQHWISELNKAIPATDPQRSILMGFLGGPENMPDALVERINSASKLMASGWIDQLKASPKLRAEVVAKWTERERTREQMAPPTPPAPAVPAESVVPDVLPKWLADEGPTSIDNWQIEEREAAFASIIGSLS